MLWFLQYFYNVMIFPMLARLSLNFRHVLSSHPLLLLGNSRLFSDLKCRWQMRWNGDLCSFDCAPHNAFVVRCGLCLCSDWAEEIWFSLGGNIFSRKMFETDLWIYCLDIGLGTIFRTAFWFSSYYFGTRVLWPGISDANSLPSRIYQNLSAFQLSNGNVLKS